MARKQDINQEVVVVCSDGREKAGKIVSVDAEGNSMTLLTSRGKNIEICQDEIAEIWIDPTEDIYTRPGVPLERPVLVAGFYKHKISQRVWNVDLAEQITGPVLFTFDRKKIYNWWSDYPQKLKPKEIEIFEEDNPFWANYSKKRKKEAQEILKKKNKK